MDGSLGQVNLVYPASLRGSHHASDGKPCGCHPASQGEAICPASKKPLWLCIADETQASTATCKKVFDLIASKSFEVLSCSYGPSSRTEAVETYILLEQPSPMEGIESYFRDETDHPFELLRPGDSECPSDTRALELIYRMLRF